MEIENLVRMLEKAADINIKGKAKTFFDVSGFPHYENVISNILAYFFDATEEHGFKDLWLKSLFECYNEKANTNIQPNEIEEIKREHSTEENKRLDIIISLSDMVVAIENKIYATPYNPFDMYHKEILNYCKEEKKESKQVIEILLSLKQEDNQRTKYNTIFYNITYKSLIAQVKNNLGNYIEDINEKWFIFMKELLNNIENLGERDNMDSKWQRFLKENSEIITKFFENYKKDIQTKIIYMGDLAQRVNEKIKGEYNNLPITAEPYHAKNSGSFKGYFSLYINIQKNGNIFAIEPYISREDPAYLVIEIWNRDNTKYDWVSEYELFKSDFPNAQIVTDGTWGKCLRFEKLDLEKNISVDEVADKLLVIIRKMI